MALPLAPASADVATLLRLPVELAEEILVLAVRALSEPFPDQSEEQSAARCRYWAEHDHKPNLHLRAHLASCLYVLPTAAIPRVVRAVLERMQHCAPDAASGAGRVDILAMRRKLGLWLTETGTLKCHVSTCYSSIAAATRRGHIAVLNWWVHESNVRLDIPAGVLKCASVLESQADDPSMLEWWFTSGLLRGPAYERQPVDMCLMLASQKGHIRILECWRTVGAKFISHNIPPIRGLDAACIDGRVDVLDWWVASGLSYEYTTLALEFATKFGHIDVLDWWAKSGLPWELPRDLSRIIIHSRSKAVVEWWAAHGHCPQLSHAELAAAASNEEFDVLKYWAWTTPGLEGRDCTIELEQAHGILRGED
ncbi:hypothetical protein AMAG_13381 [Allomyces macrogynus ATCC 38327]|uniref:Uncharacterized protein n=1 Tax=Allomyces macrogynus (strain ATCC 38327) TaxID=578462 RepID=A0A0L0T268_ALLM3|nr:hypothetical protein AMAG_13381 [Allomyces macrogynus ATCC 38327]|eukprot:KNE68740.1 hypothetical protein AMAG_13381 [Allomyces macrogynus ATCC 38327]